MDDTKSQTQQQDVQRALADGITGPPAAHATTSTSGLSAPPSGGLDPEGAVEPSVGPDPSAVRALLIGDVAGHLGELRWALGAHGVDLDTATIPEGLVVVQAGDLVHRGPDSAGVIALVDRFLRGPHAERWIQLIGNHEQPYLFDQPSVIDRELDAHSVDTLRAWWADGLAHVAAAITPDWNQVALPWRMRSVRSAGDILVTHAGLTHGAWSELGRPPTAAAAAAAINVDARGPATVTLREGRMSTGTTNLAAGPLWAQAGAELLTSWDHTTDAPNLNQVHGHSTVREWAQKRWWRGAAPIIYRGDLVADPATRRELARIGHRLIWGIDPGHKDIPAPAWQPLVLPLEQGRPGSSGVDPGNRRASGCLFPRFS